MDTIFFARLESMCSQNPVKDVSGLLKALDLSTSKGTAWRNGAIPKGDILLKIASYFHVSTDYLLGNTDDPTPAGQKEKPPAQGGEQNEKDMRIIQWFHSLPPETRKAILTLGGGPIDLAE